MKLTTGKYFNLLFLILATTNTFAQKNEVKNPVFEPVFADPSVIYIPKENKFYAYATQDNWGNGINLVNIIKSADLVNWTYIGKAFTEKPSWKTKGSIWAPDINFINNKYYLYYSFSTWGDRNPGIGLAIADHPAGPFKDQGKLFDSESLQVPNSIDPIFIQVDNRNYLVWGSFDDTDNQGIHGIELNKLGTAIADGAQKFKIAAGDWEASVIHYKDGYYYYFGSKGSCCEGANSKYHMLVARSKNFKGPYLDKEGNSILERGRGTLIMKGNDTIVGPGHMSKIMTDKNGKDWVLLHAFDKNNARLPNNANKRALYLDQIQWKAGWPYIEGLQPHTVLSEAPKF
jgi:arabinan endo-1,5-alpha-L-arabinosidase